MQEEGRLRPETVVVAAGRPRPAPGAPLSPPLVLSSTYRAGGELLYGRFGNATWEALEDAVGRLEGGSAVAFSSGMAAAAALLDVLPAGARAVAPTGGYYGVRELLAEQQAVGRLQVDLVDVADTAATLRALGGAQLLWVETPTNPLLEVADLAALTDGAKAAGAMVVVDSTFATPLLQRPLELGSDAVLHSATKYLGGHADLLLGILVTRDGELAARLRRLRAIGGSIPGALEAFLALRGLRTLAVRLERAQANAHVLAERLSAHPVVGRVRYPGLPGHAGHELARRQMRGFGAMLAFEVHGGAPAAERVCAATRVIAHATSLGGVESLIERRASHAGEEGTPPSLLRLSIGIEHVEDLWADLDSALGAAVD